MRQYPQPLAQPAFLVRGWYGYHCMAGCRLPHTTLRISICISKHFYVLFSDKFEGSADAFSSGLEHRRYYPFSEGHYAVHMKPYSRAGAKSAGTAAANTSTVLEWHERTDHPSPSDTSSFTGS